MWVKLDDKFHSNAKVYAVGNEGAGLYARALSYCADHLTDGFVPSAWVQSIANDKVAEKLTAARLWRPVDGGFFIDGYLELNPSKSEQQAKRAAKREAGRRGAEKRWAGSSTDGTSHRSGMAEPMGAATGVASRTHDRRIAPVPVPVPVPVEDSPSSRSVARENETNGRQGAEDFTPIGDGLEAELERLVSVGEGGDDDIVF
jgi:hypothetical protein